MFEGSVSLSLDAKGRLAIPAKYREALFAASPDGVVLTAHPHRCLLIYPEPAWQPIRDQLNKVSTLDPRAAPVRRVMVGNARVEVVDGAGRLLVSPALREYAGFDKTVFLVGMGTHFELWSESRWQEQNNLASEVFGGEMPAALEGLVL